MSDRLIRWLCCGMIALSVIDPGRELPVLADPGTASSPAVGYVEQLLGNLENFSIERAGTSIPLALLLPVRVGDRLVVRGTGSVALLQCGNRHIRVTERDSPFVVPSAPAPPSFLNRLGSLLIELGNRLTTQQAKTVTKVSTSSRGEEEPLAFPLLQDRTNRLPSGGSTLYLGWTGGVPPYEVRVLPQQSGVRQVARLTGVGRPRVTIPLASPLPVGFFRVEISDRDGTQVRGTFEAAASLQPPVLDPTLQEADVPASLRTVLSVDGWVKRNPDEWSLYAYQSIASLAESFEPARILRDCLEETRTCYER